MVGGELEIIGVILALLTVSGVLLGRLSAPPALYRSSALRRPPILRRFTVMLGAAYRAIKNFCTNLIWGRPEWAAQPQQMPQSEAQAKAAQHAPFTAPELNILVAGLDDMPDMRAALLAFLQDDAAFLEPQLALFFTALKRRFPMDKHIWRKRLADIDLYSEEFLRSEQAQGLIWLQRGLDGETLEIEIFTPSSNARFVGFRFDILHFPGAQLKVPLPRHEQINGDAHSDTRNDTRNDMSSDADINQLQQISALIIAQVLYVTGTQPYHAIRSQHVMPVRALYQPQGIVHAPDMLRKMLHHIERSRGNEGRVSPDQSVLNMHKTDAYQDIARDLKDPIERLRARAILWLRTELLLRAHGAGVPGSDAQEGAQWSKDCALLCADYETFLLHWRRHYWGGRHHRDHKNGHAPNGNAGHSDHDTVWLGPDEANQLAEHFAQFVANYVSLRLALSTVHNNIESAAETLDWLLALMNELRDFAKTGDAQSAQAALPALSIVQARILLYLAARQNDPVAAQQAQKILQDISQEISREASPLIARNFESAYDLTLQYNAHKLLAHHCALSGYKRAGQRVYENEVRYLQAALGGIYQAECAAMRQDYEAGRAASLPRDHFAGSDESLALAIDLVSAFIRLAKRQGRRRPIEQAIGILRLLLAPVPNSAAHAQRRQGLTPRTQALLQAHLGRALYLGFRLGAGRAYLAEAEKYLSLAQNADQAILARSYALPPGSPLREPGGQSDFLLAHGLYEFDAAKLQRSLEQTRAILARLEEDDALKGQTLDACETSPDGPHMPERSACQINERENQPRKNGYDKDLAVLKNAARWPELSSALKAVERAWADIMVHHIGGGEKCETILLPPTNPANPANPVPPTDPAEGMFKDAVIAGHKLKKQNGYAGAAYRNGANIEELLRAAPRRQILYSLAPWAFAAIAPQHAHFEPLEHAIRAYRHLLALLNEDITPILWAKLQNELGEILALYGGYPGQSARYEQAAHAFRKAGQALARSQAHGPRAKVLTNLGNVLADLGYEEQESLRLNRAAQAFKEASALYKEHFPNDKPYRDDKPYRAGLLKEQLWQIERSLR